MSNFRVAVEFAEDGGNPKTYYILVNTTTFSRIRDVENHIRKTLKITSPFLLSIGNVFLPSEESVELIQQTDMLKINFTSNDSVHREQAHSPAPQVSPTPPKPKKKKRAPQPASTGLGEVLSFLRKDVEKFDEASQPASTIGDESVEEMVVGDHPNGNENGELSSVRRKRKRRSRRRSIGHDGTDITPPTKESYSNPVEKTSQTRSHIYFDETQSRNFPVAPETPTVQQSPVPNGQDEDWKQRLLSNATLSQSKKTYYRNKVSSCFDDVDLDEVDPFKYPVLTEPKQHQVVAFKVLKMDDNYTPQISSLIVASVTDVNGPELSFKILRGREEFSEPTGKFSFEGSSDDLKDSVSLRLDELIQPRLIKN